MRAIIQNGAARYTVSCIYEKISSIPASAARLTSAILAKTGVEIYTAAYDSQGVLRHLWSPKGVRVALYRESGALSDLYAAEGNHLAHYNKEGVLCDLYDTTRRNGKVIATCRADGTLATLSDESGKPLADLDEKETVIAVRHPASDLLSEEDEEYADRLTLAEARLPLAKQMQEQERERRAWFDALYTETLQNRAAGREIAILPMGDADTATLAERDLPLTGYAVDFAGETLTVRAYADLLLQGALAALAGTVEEGADTWTLPVDYTARFTDCRIDTKLPDLKTEGGILRGVYYCGDENFEYCYGNVTAEEFDGYGKALLASGFELYAENQFGDCRFGTYVTETVSVFTMYYPAIDRTQIVYGPRGFLPATTPAEMPENPVQTTFTQQERARSWCGVVSPGVPGMCLVVQLADGSYVVIDGGTRDGKVITKVKKKGVWVDLPEIDSHDTENLYRFLCDNAPNGEKPRVAVWFMTHPHMDHTDLAVDFLEAYQGKVTVDLAAFNVPDFDSVYSRNENPARHKMLFTPFREKVTELYGAKVCILHAGQKMLLPGCEIDVIYTQEDYYPAPFTTGNQLSCAFRMRFADKTVMVLGDCDGPITKIIAKAYGESLKSDVVQVTHHGANGGCVEIYQHIDADECIWAIDRYRFENDSRMNGKEDGYLFNRYLQDQTIKKRKHYTTAETVTIKV